LTNVQKPKLLQLCAVDYTAFYLLRPLARALKNEYEVHFASARGSHVAVIEQEGFVYHGIPVARSYNVFAHLRSLFRLRRLMRRERFDVVHTHTPIASLLGRVAARLAGVPIVLYTAHGFYFHEGMGPFARRFFIALERFGGRFTNFIFTQSLEDRDAAIRLGIADENRILHIGNGVDLVRFDADRLARRRDAFRQSLGVPADGLVVSTVGRLVREKGYLELIEAFADVAERFPNARLIIVGAALPSAHDDVSTQVQHAIRDKGLSDHVRILPQETAVEEVLAASDLFALPSHREGMPRSILEAMAMALPVVATDIRGSREAVTDGSTGRLVPVSDARSLSRAITGLLADPGLRAEFGNRAQRIAIKEFNEDDVIEKQLGVLRELRRVSAG
jgi:glycosyltransferase involved in cell wall biosynthesis